MFDCKPARAPTLYFIGVTTTRSSIMRVFPLWAKELGIEADIRGIDLPLHAPDGDYRRVVRFLKEDPLSMGALVTTHKLDLFRSCRDLFDEIDPFAETLGEVSCLSKRGGRFRAHAKDPISSSLALAHFVPEGFWRAHGGEVLLLGAGGSALAMSLYFARETSGGDRPGKITIANRSRPRLDEAARKLSGLSPEVEFAFVHGPAPEDNDRLVKALPPYSLVVNATGLGKDAPGSPTTDAVDYPAHSLVWEINYRGDLLFKDQAERQRAAKDLHVEDGWIYFIHGWTQVVAEVFDIPIGGALLERLSGLAKGAGQEATP
ncbi:MAG: shikimate dehydrogenase [Oscillospiraceae bacterium]|jgi:shikimate 5-dehydrogenase|nr:shikimate dehydrogenase [Oscillospiraceae bacterium]